MHAVASEIEALEKRVYTSTWDDGLIDLFAGLGLTLVGIAWLFDLVALGPIAPAVIISCWPAARRRIREPRAGYVRIGESRRRQEKSNVWFLMALATATFLLGLFGYVYLVRAGVPTAGIVRLLVPGLPAALLGIGTLIVGRMLGLVRFYAYGLALFSGAAVVAGLRFDPGAALIVGGAAMLLTGAALLKRFLRLYPVPAAEDRD